MRTLHKFSLSLLISLLLATVFGVLAFSGYFSVLETRFFAENVYARHRPLARMALQEYINWREAVDRDLESLVVDTGVFRLVKVNIAREDFLEVFQAIETTRNDWQLDGIRLVDLLGDVHFSTRAEDVAAESAGRRQYKARDQVDHVIALEDLVPEASYEPRFMWVEDRQAFLWQRPITDEAGLYWGTLYAWASPAYLTAQSRLIFSDHRITTYPLDKDRILANGQDPDPRLARTLEPLWGQTYRTVVRGDQTRAYLFYDFPDVPGSLAVEIPSELLILPDMIRAFLLLIVFVSLFLAVFLLFNIRPDAMVVLAHRIKQLQLMLLQNYLENRGSMQEDRWLLELKSRREEVRAYILDGLGKKQAKKKEAQAFIDAGWDEILAVLDARSTQAQSLGTLDLQKLEGLIEKVLANVSVHGLPPAAKTQGQLGPGHAKEASGPATKAPAAKDKGATVGGIAAPVIATAKALEPPRPSKARPVPVEAASDDDDLEDLEDIEEAEEVDEAEPLDEAAPARTPAAEALDEADEVEDLEDIEEAEEVDEAEALDEADEVEDLEDIEEAEEVDEAEPLDEADDPAAAVTPAAEALDEADEVEDLEDIEEAEEVDEAEPLDEAAPARTPAAEALDEADEVEDLEDIEEAEEVDEADDLDEAAPARTPAAEVLDEADEVEDIEEAEEVDEAEPLDDAGPARTPAAEALDEADEVEDIEEAEEVDEAEPLDEADDPAVAVTTGAAASADLDDFEAALAATETEATMADDEVEDLEDLEDIEEAEAVDEAEPLDDTGVANEVSEPAVVNPGFPVFDQRIPSLVIPSVRVPARQSPLAVAEVQTLDADPRISRALIPAFTGPVESLQGVEPYDELRIALGKAARVQAWTELMGFDREVWAFTEDADGVVTIVDQAFRSANEEAWHSLAASAEPTTDIETPAEVRSFYRPAVIRHDDVNFTSRGIDFSTYLEYFRKDEGGRIKAMFSFTKLFKAEFLILGELTDEGLEVLRKIGVHDTCVDTFVPLDPGTFDDLDQPTIIHTTEPQRLWTLFRSPCTEFRGYQTVIWLPMVYEDRLVYGILGYSNAQGFNDFVSTYLKALRKK